MRNRRWRAARSGADGTAGPTVGVAVQSPASEAAVCEESRPARRRHAPKRYDDFVRDAIKRRSSKETASDVAGRDGTASKTAVRPQDCRRFCEETASSTAVRPRDRPQLIEETASNAAVCEETASDTAVHPRRSAEQTAFGVAASDGVTTTPGSQQGVDVPKAHRRRRRRRRQSVPSIEATAPTAFDHGVGGWSPEVVRDMQLRDADIAPAVAWLESGSRPPWTDVQACSPMLRALWQQYDSLCVRNGIPYRSFHDEKGMVTCYQLVLLQVT